MLLSDDELAFINAIYLKKETGKGAAATASGERRRHGSSSKGSIQMGVILRVNKKFMAYMKENHDPELTRQCTEHIELFSQIA